MLHMALMNYKNEYGSFPPANMSGLWNGTSVNQRHQAYKHLTRIFPRLSECTQDMTVNGMVFESPYKYLAQLSPAQSLVFWLQGFYENPEKPISNGSQFTNGAGSGSRKKLFDFDQSRFYAVTNDLNNQYVTYTVGSLPPLPNRQAFQPLASGNDFQKSFPVYFTGHPSCGLPYVYFDSRCYSDRPVNDTVYAATSMTGDTSTAAPYITSLPPINPTWGQQHCVSDTFQIIAAGKDGSYGNTQAAFPGNVGNPPPLGGYFSVGNMNAAGHADNITNFADRPLANAIEALSNQ
jgi:hypothetical protein